MVYGQATIIRRCKHTNSLFVNSIINNTFGVFTQEIVRKVGELESNSGWRANLIPFCGDESGMLVVNSSTEEVLEWDADDGLGDAVAGSFAQYLETFRDSLLAGRVEYLDGAGVIEKVSGGRRK